MMRHLHSLFVMLRTRALILAIVLAGVTPAYAQVFAPAQGKVENVVWVRDGTTFTVTYDLVSSDPTAAFKVGLVVSMDGGEFKPVSVAGDIGDKVIPGTAKKIVWQVARDTDNQDYDLFKFSVTAVSGRAVPVANPSPGTATAPAASQDLRGLWRGTYANAARAELVIDGQAGIGFTGRLRISMAAGDDPTELRVIGSLTSQVVEIREIEIIKAGKYKKWNLGTAAGNVLPDGLQMSGSGRDRRTTYAWSFTRVDAPPVGAPAAAVSTAPDLAGMWTGKYAGFRATLTLTSISESTFSGTLSVVTSSGKAPTELQVEVTVTQNSVSLRETSVIAKGAASRWNLGTATGQLQEGNRQMAGQGRDARGKFEWTLAK